MIFLDCLASRTHHAAELEEQSSKHEDHDQDRKDKGDEEEHVDIAFYSLVLAALFFSNKQKSTAFHEDARYEIFEYEVHS